MCCWCAKECVEECEEEFGVSPRSESEHRSGEDRRSDQLSEEDLEALTVANTAQNASTQTGYAGQIEELQLGQNSIRGQMEDIKTQLSSIVQGLVELNSRSRNKTPRSPPSYGSQKSKESMSARELAVVEAIEAIGEMEPVEYGEIGDILDPPQPISTKFGDSFLVQDNLPGIDVSVHFLEPLEEGEDEKFYGRDNRMLSQDAIDMTPKIRLPQRKEKIENQRKQNIINAFSSVENSEDIASHIVNLQNAFDIHKKNQKREEREYKRAQVKEELHLNTTITSSPPRPMRLYPTSRPSGFNSKKVVTPEASSGRYDQYDDAPDTSSRDYEQYHKYSALGILSDYEPTNSPDGQQFSNFINRMQDKFETSAASSSVFDDITTETSL